MPKITNTSRAPIPLRVGDKTETLQPGEGRDLKIDEKDPRIVGLAHAGEIVIGERAAKAVARRDPDPAT